MSESKMPAVEPVEPRGGVVPYLTVDGAIAATEFYKKAFGAEVLTQMPADDKGRTMHVHLLINGSSVMLSDAYPEHGHPWKQPEGFTLHLQLTDVDSWWKRAEAAGCTVMLPLQLMFWGDRYGQLKDPYGVSWSLAQHA